MKIFKVICTVITVILECMVSYGGENAGKTSNYDSAFAREMQNTCLKYEKQAHEFYESKVDKAINEPPFIVMLSHHQFREVRDEFLGLSGNNINDWILGVEHNLKKKISSNTYPSSFLWRPYIYITMRDCPGVGRMAIRNFISQNRLSPVACLDFFGTLAPFIGAFMARDVFAEKDIIAMLRRILEDKSPSYGFRMQMPSQDALVPDAYNNMLSSPKPGKTIKAKLRICDWGCSFTAIWFASKEVCFDGGKFLESSESQRDQIVAQMQKFLSGREKALAPTQALEDELRGQYAARMTVADFAAKLAEWQKRANDPTGDGTLQLLLDTLFYQVGRNAEAAMDARDTQMTAYLAGKVSEIFAKDGLKILAGKEGGNLRHKDDFFRFLNPLNVQLYEKKRPLDMARNAQLRILANIYEQKYHSGELFRLPEGKAETPKTPGAKTPAPAKPGK